MRLNLDFVGRQRIIVGMNEKRKNTFKIAVQNLRSKSLPMSRATGYHFSQDFLSIVSLIVSGGFEPHA